MADIAHHARQVSRRADRSTWVDVAGRLGLASQAVLYIVVGLLAIQVASGDSERADKDGAIEAVARQPFGRGLLIVLAVGLALHALWRFSLAIRPGDGAKETAMRFGNAARGVLYVAFTATAVHFLMTHQASSGSGEKERKATATVFDWPAGRFIVAAAGVAAIAGGLWQLRSAFTRSFMKKLRTDSDAVATIGTIGFVARGVVFALVGAFFVRAAWTYDPNEAKGIDGALKELAASGSGPWLLGLVAAGLLAFGAFRIVDASLRKDDYT